ncbi:hypothetical protein AMAG_04401 [Allomyces macrogynus ATCC 38327]|uniref:Uncharacterized protein n=1 Tax=Allomyces macrogynus (strain ATCC 38327) TaxID=578462 RepID=A0A0L0S8E1_ALLM3|nr:hypothetical protein AMAG_04401 [Allomyces macrogynus ATCC 38327]|eukprot:KNE58863.1 hypothetical protein AMAG_04401 [Allomyces macrogynus ATCC 38327]
MDHAYLESTVAPVLTDALTSLAVRLAGTYMPPASTRTAPPPVHPTMDAIEYVARYLLHSLHDRDADLKLDEAKRRATRDVRIAQAAEDEVRRKLGAAHRPVVPAAENAAGGESAESRPPVDEEGEGAAAAPVPGSASGRRPLTSANGADGNEESAAEDATGEETGEPGPEGDDDAQARDDATAVEPTDEAPEPTAAD